MHDVTDASKVKCSGPGLSPGMVRANLPQSFQVDTSKAGVAPLQVKVQGPKGEHLSDREWVAMEPVPRDRGPPGNRTRPLSRCGRREGGQGSKVAPRLVSSVAAAQDHSLGRAGEGKARSRPGVGAEGPSSQSFGGPVWWGRGVPGNWLSLSLGLGPGLVEPVDVVDNADGTQTVNYVPSREGPYSISVLYGEEEVPRR